MSHRDWVVAKAMKLPGWCPADKAEWLYETACGLSQLVERPVAAEIGVFGGRSLLPIAHGLGEAGTTYAVDSWEASDTIVGVDAVHREHWEGQNLTPVRNAFFQALEDQGVANRVIVFQMTSDRAASRVRSRLHLLHVDGNHSKEQCERDFQLWVPKLVEGGILVVDDVESPSWKGVDEALPWLDGRAEVIHHGERWRAYRVTASRP